MQRCSDAESNYVPAQYSMYFRCGINVLMPHLTFRFSSRRHAAHSERGAERFGSGSGQQYGISFVHFVYQIECAAKSMLPVDILLVSQHKIAGADVA